MADGENENENIGEQGASDRLPTPTVVRARRWELPLIWLVPLLAAAIGLSLVIHAWRSKGPVITVSFTTAESIEPGKTQVKFKNVVIGKVNAVALTEDRQTVSIQIALEKRYAYFATKGSRFWVVRPRIGLGGVSGLSTLFSGAFIGADTGGTQEQDTQTHFKGLETPPPLTHGEPGSTFTVRSDTLGSLDIGSPVYFRHVQVGRVVGYKLGEDGKDVRIRLFVDNPYDQYVTGDSRFWNVSGINVSVDAAGLKLNTESLAAIVAGGIAFRTPSGRHHGESAAADTTFKLFTSRDMAMQPPNGPPLRLHMRFKQSVRGLAVGALVDFEGISLGSVTHINVEFDPAHNRFPINVTAVIYPRRLGRASDQFIANSGDAKDKSLSGGLATLIKHGLRAQIRSGNLLTGQLYIALDFFPHDVHKEVDTSQRRLWVPTVPGSFDQLQAQLARIADRLDKVPIDRIGQHLNQTLVQADALFKQINGKLAPQASETLRQIQTTLHSLDQSVSSGSPLQLNLNQTLLQIQDAARSLRVLGNYLSRHPEALLRGKHNNDPAPLNTPTTRKQPPSAADGGGEP